MIFNISLCHLSRSASPTLPFSFRLFRRFIILFIYFGIGDSIFDSRRSRRYCPLSNTSALNVITNNIENRIARDKYHAHKEAQELRRGPLNAGDDHFDKE